MEPAVLRDDMVDSLEHESKGCVHSDAVSVAMRAVPRHAFVEDDRAAYADRPFERFGTRVLAPSTAARLLEALAPEAGDNVLIVGAGVGYTAAVVAEIVGECNVQAIDITRRLVYDARENLAEAGYEGVLVDRRDGVNGLPEYAPYDRILLEAAAIDPPQALVDQLAEDGRLVMPLGASDQALVTVEGGEIADRLGGVAFQPMLVEGEQADTVERNRTRREDREHARRDAERRRGWQQDWIDWDDQV
ncbi:protein-L-isoaspartate O-methyltransferase family protein [Halorientalis salina]|uniref:protein-L-isoaspartate O-methyltransferase family protein n=1 Tax=Halorientalis salina TaxID=2932266 RepID=UPI0010AD8258|nr:protein-L-isoaspartate O-methyltransferase [Halorientalis salina]